jgi:hypothetical protein
MRNRGLLLTKTAFGSAVDHSDKAERHFAEIDIGVCDDEVMGTVRSLISTLRKLSPSDTSDHSSEYLRARASAAIVGFE